MAKPLRILIVEDLASDAELLVRQLKRDEVDFEYCNVSTGEEFVNALRDFSPDIILSDHSLPQFSSWEALRIARDHDPHIPFILVTGTVSEEFAVDILHAGADDYILKSSLTRLSNAIANSVQRRLNEKEREQMVERLMKSEARLAAFTENSPALQWIMGPSGKFVFVNKALKESFQLPDSWHELGTADVLGDELASHLAEIDREVLNTGQAKQTIEQVPHSDGSMHYYMVSKFPMPRGHIGGIGIDITAQKQAEEKMKMLNEELNTFIYKASHDLKGPLSSIMGIANLTRTEQFDEKAKRYIDMIAESTSRLDKILLGLIEVMSVKQSEIKPVKIDFHELIEEVLRSLQFGPGFSNMLFNISINVQDPFYSDRSVIVSIIQNMVENSVKYQDPLAKEHYLDITVTGNGQGVQLEFNDNGFGIDEEVMSRIFDMFFRGTEESKGSGLGLYIVRNAVDKLGGNINVESEKGKGSRFTVQLPSVNHQ